MRHRSGQNQLSPANDMPDIATKIVPLCSICFKSSFETRLNKQVTVLAQVSHFLAEMFVLKYLNELNRVKPCQSVATRGSLS